mmetsp:Transcript_31993/g.67251  ORF Transcript_31993/g.67251 Transcript_31993/m.67251 type:complete len:670 (-) Transcript_31993:449-2458(-)|eukprot:CAMPEP_0172307594 /NCGR_PEP_ID=MMETSP1058-20130122/8412_1 /TAXON_ID=83371 /ORGANISM="Detonula confervacea, Strain CCMP 353" /LENGTH=669 /DNA_ID=CAMNT_0013019803 /DNA_START=77 /DNA_END=2086 /DNA_ORIENTATION=-
MGRKKRKIIEREAPHVPLAVASQQHVQTETTTSPAIISGHTVHATDSRGSVMTTSPPSTMAMSSDPRNKGFPQTMMQQDFAAPQSTTITSSIQIKSATMTSTAINEELAEDYLGSAKPASQYGLHSHSGDLIAEDIYVSDGSLDLDDENPNDGGADGNGEKKGAVDLVITTSKMGLMRRGGISSLLGAPSQINRTWVRPGDRDGDSKDDENKGENSKDKECTKEEEANEEEANLDPGQRLALQQRKIEAAKINVRVLESSENAGRDPCLFSKRTAFDIRMDQIEEKPWDKGEADITDYFNYGMMEEDWLEYAERQLAVRQELTDASKQKRLPDPGIVTVVPRAPRVQGDRVAVRKKKVVEDEEGENEGEEKNENHDNYGDCGLEMGVELGPLNTVEKEKSSGSEENEKEVWEKFKKEKEDAAPSSTASSSAKQEKVIGGAWGAGAAKDSVLLRLILEQSSGPDGGNHTGIMPPSGGPLMMNMPPPTMPPPPSSRNVLPLHYPSPMKQEQYNSIKEGDGIHHDDGGQWKRDRYQNNFHWQVTNGGADQQQQHQPLNHAGGRGAFQQQQGYHHNQQQYHQPTPGQYHRGGQGPLPPRSTYQQGHRGGGGVNSGGYYDQRGGGPLPRGGGGPIPLNNTNGPPPHGNWENNCKRPRNNYGGGELRGDPRRGRW